MKGASMNLSLREEARLSSQLPSPPLARNIRIAAGISVNRLASAVGVHPVTVSRWEAGTRSPRGELRLIYAVALQDLLRGGSDA